MAAKVRELFISYRSSDAPKVDKIAKDLSLLKYADGTPRYTTWQDKHNLPPASPNWWDAIVDAIERCDIFVFNLSQASLQSEVCRAELEYAHRRNRPIIPVVLDGEFFLNPESGKYDLPKETWALVPDWLAQAQFLFYLETQFYDKFEEAVAVFERSWPRDISAPRPLSPDSKSVHGSNHAVYAAARDYAYRLAFADAEKHFDTLVRRNDVLFADASAHWLERIRLYAELIEAVEQRSPAFVFKKLWADYEALPTEYLDGESFDPKGFATRGQVIVQVVVPPPTRIVTPAPTKPRSIDLLPSPFSWVPISAGKVTLITEIGWAKNYISEGNVQTFDIAAFQIAKYPLTNAQYRLFIDAGGYTQDSWWTADGWQARERNNWTEPRFWQDTKWNKPDNPLVGVSWYEAIAYCNWLSDLTGELVCLPTEQQWQRAAQENENRQYPWGETWDGSRCNNLVGQYNSDGTTPVTQYEKKGDSPFGVVDMSGNVWEWCSTAYENGRNDINGTDVRVLRGGSWSNGSTNDFRCACRNRNSPGNRINNRGFRVALSS